MRVHHIITEAHANARTMLLGEISPIFCSMHTASESSVQYANGGMVGIYSAVLYMCVYRVGAERINCRASKYEQHIFLDRQDKNL